jgi:hypothetical protein
MAEFLNIAGIALIVVNLILAIVGIFPQFQQSKALDFLGGEFSFAAAVVFVALAVLPGGDLVLTFMAALFFVNGSLSFASALW